MVKPRVETTRVILVDKYTKTHLDKTMEILNEFYNDYEICNCIADDTSYEMGMLIDSFAELLNLIKAEE